MSDTKTYYTRDQMMQDLTTLHSTVSDPDERKAASFANHRRYYAQMVNERTCFEVLRIIGFRRLLASNDPHFNDIPLGTWDMVARMCPPAVKPPVVGCTFFSLSDAVCWTKEAARQVVEAATAQVHGAEPGTEGQDRESYSDEQDRESYTTKD